MFDNITLSFDDNKVLKIPIGYANNCSSVQDHRQKFSVFINKQRFCITIKEQRIFYKKEACVAREHLKDTRSWRHQKLKIRAFEDDQELTSLEAEDHQKLKFNSLKNWSQILLQHVILKIYDCRINGNME